MPLTGMLQGKALFVNNFIIFTKACLGASQPNKGQTDVNQFNAFGCPDSSASPGSGPTRGLERLFHKTLRHLGMPCRLPSLRSAAKIFSG